MTEKPKPHVKPEDLKLTKEETQTDVGRPWFDGKEENDVVSKLETAFGIGCNVIQACSFADISRPAFYRYLERNTELRDRIESLRQKPLLRAKFTVFKALKNDPNMAMRYIEKFSGEAKEEPGISININNLNGGPIQRKAQANAVKEKLVKFYENEMYKIMTQDPDILEGEIIEDNLPDNEPAKTPKSNTHVQQSNPHQNDAKRTTKPSGQDSNAQRVDHGQNPAAHEQKSSDGKK